MFDSSKLKLNIGLLKSKLNIGSGMMDKGDEGGGGVDGGAIDDDGDTGIDDTWGRIMRICEVLRLRIPFDRIN
jgi:hypothetical protein